MRNSIALVLAGEIIALVGIGLWSISLALIVLGGQLVWLGLVRDAHAEAAQPTKRPATKGARHRYIRARTFIGRARPKLKLIRGAAS